VSVEKSPSTGRAYGIERASSALAVMRSSFFERKRRNPAERSKSKKRGPVPSVSDKKLLALIKEDLGASAFIGEGYRKVSARLKFGRGIADSRKRMLRLMRENNLLSSNRQPQMPLNERDGQITTSEPSMWGSDGARVFTRFEGWGWIFVNMEHWNAECMGWHATKKGDRFAALEPVAMGVMSVYGSVERDVASGLSLRMDHGTQYPSDHLQSQIEAWSIVKSVAFLERFRANGVAERFLRTLQGQVIYGRVFDTIEEVRQAIADFGERYNNEWLLENNGYLSPPQARVAYYEREMEAVA